MINGKSPPIGIFNSMSKNVLLTLIKNTSRYKWKYKSKLYLNLLSV